jgi:type I thyroxine 5'-deiodinase
MNKLFDKYTQLADFITVYITEAHPKDGWSFENNPDISFAKCLQDRLSAAAYFQETFEPKGPLVVDSMDDNANLAYGAVPERLYIILDGRVVYKGREGPHGYHPEGVEDFLMQHLQK